MKKNYLIAVFAGVALTLGVIYVEQRVEQPAHAQASQSLDDVQKAFVQESVRPMIEDILKFKHKLDAFVDDYDNQQVAITVNGDTLNDGIGEAPRVGAPELTGTRISQLRTVAANMSTELDGPTYNILVSLAVRDLNTILSGN